MGAWKAIGKLVVASATVLALAAPVSAGGAVATTIELTGVNGVETFVTTGGVLCPSGTATTDEIFFAGGPRAGTFHGVKTLTCDDTSGSFRITFNAGTVFGSPQDQGGWKVIDGTDAYATLRGGGNLVGTYIPNGIIDLYTGRVKV